MNGFQSKRVSVVLTALTLFLTYHAAYASQASDRAESHQPFDSAHGLWPWALAQDSAHTGVEHGATGSARAAPHVRALVEAGRKMVMHINTAAKSGNLSEIHVHAKESVRLGETLLMHAKAAIEHVQEVVEISAPQDEVQGYREQAVFHLKEVIRHGKSAVMHAHHATHSKGLRGGLSHVRESAKHARISALYALEGEYLVQGL